MEGLRTYQQECIASMFRSTGGLINMWCGTGKTTIFTSYILEKNEKFTVVVEPSISLKTSASTKAVKKSIRVSLQLSRIVSFDVQQKENKKLKGISIKFTTDENEIFKYISTNNKNNKLVIVTYASFNNFINTYKKFLSECDEDDFYMINTIIYDEAHRTTSENIYNIVYNDEDEDYNENLFDKSFFFTATPVNKNGITMLEYDDSEKIFNTDCKELIYRYPYYEAIQDGYCSDFKIKYGFVDNDNDMLRFIITNMLKDGNYHCLSFHKDINNSVSEFMKLFGETKQRNNVFKKKVIEIYNELIKTNQDIVLPTTFKIYDIDASNKYKPKIIEEFNNAKKEDFIIICSCRTIGEGVDTINCNSIVFTDSKKSIVDIQQNIGRCSRYQQNKVSSIIVPIEINNEELKLIEEKEEKTIYIRSKFLGKNGDYSSIMNVMLALRMMDPYLFDSCIRYDNKLTYEDVSRGLKKQNRKLELVNDVLGIHTNQQSFLQQLDVEAKKNNIKIVSLNNDEGIDCYGDLESKNIIEIFVDSRSLKIDDIEVENINDVYTISKIDDNCNEELQKVSKIKINYSNYEKIDNFEININWDADLKNMILNGTVERLSDLEKDKKGNDLLNYRRLEKRWPRTSLKNKEETLDEKYNNEKILGNLLSRCRNAERVKTNQYKVIRKILNESEFCDEWTNDTKDKQVCQANEQIQYEKKYGRWARAIKIEQVKNLEDEYEKILGSKLSDYRKSEKYERKGNPNGQYKHVRETLNEYSKIEGNSDWLYYENYKKLKYTNIIIDIHKETNFWIFNKILDSVDIIMQKETTSYEKKEKLEKIKNILKDEKEKNKCIKILSHSRECERADINYENCEKCKNVEKRCDECLKNAKLKNQYVLERKIFNEYGNNWIGDTLDEEQKSAKYIIDFKINTGLFPRQRIYKDGKLTEDEENELKYGRLLSACRQNEIKKHPTRYLTQRDFFNKSGLDWLNDKNPTNNKKSNTVKISSDKPKESTTTLNIKKLSDFVCGRRHIHKIVGGQTAIEHSWPSQAFLTICRNSLCQVCGGTLIDRNTVLTAAHC